ncbi:MAG: hypothetical protein ACI9LT_003293 [Pseudoalteromonas distincta]|jgi:hypothetical protein
MVTSFDMRMAQLDALLAECRDYEPFASAVVRDASNRSNRDWPWWGVEVQQSQVDGADNRRITATITLVSTQAGEPSHFKADWTAQTWYSTSGGQPWTKHGSHEVPWDDPTADMLIAAVDRLLTDARAALPSWAKG